MGTKEQDFRKRLLATFNIEAQDHIREIASGLVELEKLPPQAVQTDIIETVFRAAHSLKGAARAVNLADVESLCQSLESVFAIWKKKAVTSSEQRLFDTIYHTLDVIRKVIIASDDGTISHDEKKEVSKLLNELNLLAGLSEKAVEWEFETKAPAAKPREIKPQETAKPQETPAAPLTDTVRISTAKLSALLLEAEEMLTVRLTALQHADGVNEIAAMLDLLKAGSYKAYIEAQSQKTRAANGGPMSAAPSIHVQEFLNWSQSHIKSMERKLSILSKSSKLFYKNFDRMVENLLDDMKKTMMLPFSTLLESFPMLVRDIAREEGKEVSFTVRGEATEIDRRILEEMKGPLIHIVRNCVDHGIEKPYERVNIDKPRRGEITIAISGTEGNKVEIEISDDGAGIDAAKVRETSIRKEIISEAEARLLGDAEALRLIFHSGMSTSSIITDISGRGIGLAIVLEKVEKLGGAISLDTAVNRGTTFRISLPLTIATFRGILVGAAGQVFIVPTTNMEYSARVKSDGIKTVENKETVTLDGRPVAFVRLSDVLELPSKKRADDGGYTFLIVLSSGDRRIAFGVDEIISEQEVLVKPLGPQLARVRNIAGAAVLGSGKPVPILNVPDLMRAAVRTAAPARVAAPSDAERAVKGTILIAEDSITSRILLKNILESAGYTVKTAVDGVDAITSLKTEKFDLVVSDVEMPRMNGFDLTKKIRADKNLADMPIILVTALESREDRERGIDVGANAYIVKSSFNQGNLLEVVHRLI